MWKKRYFELSGSCLALYKNDKKRADQYYGYIRMSGCEVSILEEKKKFKILFKILNFVTKKAFKNKIKNRLGLNNDNTMAYGYCHFCGSLECVKLGIDKYHFNDKKLQFLCTTCTNRT